MRPRSDGPKSAPDDQNEKIASPSDNLSCTSRYELYMDGSFDTNVSKHGFPFLGFVFGFTIVTTVYRGVAFPFGDFFKT